MSSAKRPPLIARLRSRIGDPADTKRYIDELWAQFHTHRYVSGFRDCGAFVTAQTELHLQMFTQSMCDQVESGELVSRALTLHIREQFEYFGQPYLYTATYSNPIVDILERTETKAKYDFFKRLADALLDYPEE